MLTKRQFLLTAAAGAATLSRPGLGSSAAPSPASELISYDGVSLAALIRSGELSQKEVLEATLRRIDTLDGQLNAVVTRTFEQARERAESNWLRGPLAGVPYLIKDGADYKGFRKTLGSRFLKDYISPESPDLVKAYELAGLNVVGKSNLPEFGLISTTESDLLGACRNPWDLSRSVGGSSGGAAAAVAAGYVPFAHASDGAGSIRIPASCCGVFGLKPSRGRMPADRLDGKQPRFRAAHCVSRTVRDSAFLLAVTQDDSSGTTLPPLKYVRGQRGRRLRIGLCMRNYHNAEPHPEVKAAIEQTAKLCESLGHDIVLLQNPIDGEVFEEAYRAVFAVPLIATLRHIEEITGQPVEETGLMERFTYEFARASMAFPVDAVDKGERYLSVTVRQQMDGWMAPVDVLLTPVLQSPVPKLGYLRDPSKGFDVMSRRLFDYLSYMPPQNALGMPGMSVPLSMSSQGTPIGSHFAARVGEEDTLLALAYELEAAQPWANNWAPTSALHITAQGHQSFSVT